MDAAADPRENIRSFLATFETQKARVERAVDGHRTAVGTPDARPPDELRAALDALQTERDRLLNAIQSADTVGEPNR